MSWHPHVTVAALVEREGRFLTVREQGESGALVYNQPAGHLEERESLADAVVRETLEESAWEVRPVAVLSVRLYRSPHNGATYLRTSFLAKPLRHFPDRPLDEGIERALWMSEDEIRAHRPQLRSQLVLQTIADYRSGRRYPLSLLATSD